MRILFVQRVWYHKDPLDLPAHNHETTPSTQDTGGDYVAKCV